MLVEHLDTCFLSAALELNIHICSSNNLENPLLVISYFYFCTCVCVICMHVCGGVHALVYGCVEA